LVVKGTFSRLGRLWTKRRVWGVLAGDGLDDIVGRGAEELGDDRELVDVVLPWEERLALEHLGEDASGGPDVDRNVILLPGQHDLGGAVVARRDVAGHLGVLDTGETKVADLEVAVLVDENVGGFKVAVDDAGRVNVLEAAENLVQEVLDELLLQWPRGEEAVEVSAEELGDKVDVLEGRDEDVGKGDDVLVAQVLEKLELTVRPLGEDWGGERLHDLLDRHRGARKLVLGRADKAEGAHADGLEVDIARRDLEYGAEDGELDKVGHVGE
jgi:hypothetical protein